jgi:hypothetical protein
VTGTHVRPMPPTLARAHAWARRQPWLGRFTLMNRLLLAMAFLPTGLVKATGQRFTSLPVDNPVGFFFEAMYQTGPYWVFIGLMQMAAATLLLIPHTATLGAVLFLPIGLSIFLITWGVGFQGTVYITAGMLLSVTYLVCWDGDRVWSAAQTLLGARRGPRLLEGAGHVERGGWVLGGLSGIMLFLVVRGFLPSSWMRELLVGGVVALAMVISGGAWTVLRSSRQKDRGGTE